MSMSMNEENLLGDMEYVVALGPIWFFAISMGSCLFPFLFLVFSPCLILRHLVLVHFFFLLVPFSSC
jgi:hypothetical protein